MDGVTGWLCIEGSGSGDDMFLIIVLASYMLRMKWISSLLRSPDSFSERDIEAVGFNPVSTTKASIQPRRKTTRNTLGKAA